MTRLLLALATIAVLVGAPAGAGQNAFPDRIELPDGFQPEGIAIAGTQFYVGSIPTGRVYRGDLRTGEGDVLVQQQTGRQAIGLKVDRGRLFVAGGPTGMAFVYDAATGDNITSYQLAGVGTPSFINDVVVTKSAAWFTDSLNPVLYRVPLGPNGQPGGASAVQTVELDGDYVHMAGFNVNGIDATPNGKTLVIVQSNTGNLFTVSPDGDANRIALTGQDGGPESVPMGDGILLDGHTLYVVQNRLNLVAEIALSAKLDSGLVASRTGNPDFDVPTTIADHGNRLYAVNARFRSATEPPLEQPADYWITQLRK
jgi:sugar lactone lactonase YvrE